MSVAEILILVGIAVLFAIVFLNLLRTTASGGG